MSKQNILILFGGGGSEHDISIVSAQYIYDLLIPNKHFTIYSVEIKKDGTRIDKNGRKCELRKNGFLFFTDEPEIKLDFVIPCFHGYPGETGDIQSLLTMMEVPYFGCNSESSIICFNKITAKLWLDALDIPNTPYIFANSMDDLPQVQNSLKKWDSIFIKAASQGSSIGCYRTDQAPQCKELLKQALKYSPSVLIEKEIIGRELEIAIYEYEGNIITSAPGEIIKSNGKFYSYDEKYSTQSNAKTTLTPKGLEPNTIIKMKSFAIKIFKELNLRHLSRIDFLLSNDNQIFINEINTFPGMTPISMFPKLLENNGHSFKQFLTQTIFKELKK